MRGAPEAGAVSGLATGDRPADRGPAGGSSAGSGGERGRLSREAIVVAAIELIEREGEAAASMRRLAAELGTGAMSLYTYVPSKAALLDAIAEHILDRMDVDLDPADAWQDRVRVLVRAFRASARRYPRSMNVLITRQWSSQAGLRPIELALGTARSAGFGGDQAVRIVRAFVSYTLGTLATELARAHRFADIHERDPADVVSRLDRDRFPNVVDLARPLMTFDDDTDFEFGLELLLRSVEASLPPGAR